MATSRNTSIKPRVLVTGASGLVGYPLCRRLVEEGYRVVALGRQSEGEFRSKFPVPCEYHVWADPAHTPPPAEALDVEAVFHLLGEPVANRRWSAEVKASIFESRVLSTRQLVKALSELPPEARPRSFISASAIGFYGNGGERISDEQSVPGSDFLAQVCSEWEKAARQAPCRSVQVRIGVVLAPNGGALQKMRPVFEKGFGGRLGSGEQWLSWIHVEDLVEVFLHALKNAAISGPVNAVAPNPVRNAEFTWELAFALGTRAILPVPLPALRLALGERAELLLVSQRAVPSRLNAEGFTFRHPNLNGALRSIFKNPRTIEKKGNLDHEKAS